MSCTFRIYIIYVTFILKWKIVYGVIASSCTVTEVKNLLKGCENLGGLNVTTVGGTIINDHNCDVVLPKQVFLEEPMFQYSLAEPKKYYTIIIVDADAPPQIEGEFYLHMVKSNIPGLALQVKDSSKTVGVDYRGAFSGPLVSVGSLGSCLIRLMDKPALSGYLERRLRNLICEIKSNTNLSGYKPPTPSRGSGQHRYMCLLYEQADGNNFLPMVPSTRLRFSLGKWLPGKNLCGPVASIEFKTEF